MTLRDTPKKLYGITDMALPVQSINIVAPGFKGLNLEDSPLAQELSFAEVADNAIIDEKGRLGAREGYVALTTDKTELGTASIQAMGEFRDDAGNTKFYSAGNNKILSGTVTLVDETPGGYAVSANNWKIVNFNENLYFFQSGHEPLVYDGSSLTTMSSASGTHGVVSAMYGNEVIAAYGRLWTADMAADKQTIYWSDLLQGNAWGSTGSAGSIDISKVWPDGYDQIVALAAHNDFLIIFGKDNIIVYGGADSPANMTLADTVTGVGCIARDSVQYTGTDVLFLSRTGLRSFSRVIQEKSLPLTDRSRNIKNRLTSLIDNESEQIRGVYSPENQFYLLTFVNQQTTYCFDLRGELESRAYRATRWPSLSFSSFFRDDDGSLYIGTTDGVCEYGGTYTDNGVSYKFRYESPSFGFGDSSRLKMLKKIRPTIVGGTSQDITVKWSYDFSNSFASSTFQTNGSTVAYFGQALFGAAKFNSGIDVIRRSVNANGSGEVVTIGVETTINGNPFSLQEINVLATIGKYA